MSGTRLINHSVGSIEALRLFVKNHYGDSPPALTYVSGVPVYEGGGVRYHYADGSVVDAQNGRWTWWADGDDALPDDYPDPLHAAVPRGEEPLR